MLATESPARSPSGVPRELGAEAVKRQGIRWSGGDPTGVGAVLHLFRTRQVATRGDVVRVTGMARATVSQRLTALLESGYVRPAGEAASTGGRPPGRFEFNPDQGVFLLADVRASETRVAVTDLDGKVLVEARHRLDVDSGPTHVLGLVTREHDRLLDSRARPRAHVRGIGIALPGPVEYATGRVVSPPIMPSWDRFDIRSYLCDTEACPIVVDNDVNAMAVGEQRLGWPDHPDLLMIEAGTGIGSGIVTHGELYRGARGAAGDLGHIPYAPVEGLEGEPVCRCGNSACVEAYAGGWAIVRDLRAKGHDVSTVADVVELIRVRHPDVLALLRRAARVLGQAISDAVSLLNPSIVVVGGALTAADELLLAGIREVVYRRSLPLATRNLQITTSRLREDAALAGLSLELGDLVFASDRVDRLVRLPADAGDAA
jgi:predicted NBD/HSP70 family sugar kinase